MGYLKLELYKKVPVETISLNWNTFLKLTVKNNDQSPHDPGNSTWGFTIHITVSN